MFRAARPVVIFGNGLGDHLLALPAVRALAAIFEGRLALVSMPGAADLFFQGVRLRSVCETAMRSEASGKVFDAESVVRAVGPADVVLSLNPWHSSSLDQLLDMWAAPLSIGFHPNFNEQLARDYNKHSADLAFDLPRWFDPLLKIENFAEPPLTSLHARRRARRIRAAACLPMHILAVHADTGLWTPEGSRVMGARVAAEGMLGNKMWPPERFVEVLDAFLSRHPDFIAIVVGSVDLRLDRGRNGSRIVPCCGLPLDVTFALVGTSDLFLGVDSCMLHAADLYGVPGVGLFGPTNPGEFGFRFGPHVHLAGGPFMEGITVDAVLAALESLLPEAACHPTRGGARVRAT